MIVDVLRMHDPALAHEFQQEQPPACGAQQATAACLQRGQGYWNADASATEASWSRNRS